MVASKSVQHSGSIRAGPNRGGWGNPKKYPSGLMERRNGGSALGRVELAVAGTIGMVRRFLQSVFWMIKRSHSGKLKNES